LFSKNRKSQIVFDSKDCWSKYKNAFDRFNKTKTDQKKHKTHSKIKTKTYQNHCKGITKA